MADDNMFKHISHWKGYCDDDDQSDLMRKKLVDEELEWRRKVLCDELYDRVPVKMPSGATKHKLNFRKDKLKTAFSLLGPEFERMSMAELTLPLLQDNILSDVVVVCGAKTFDCHKVILAGRSQVFKKMLTGDFKERKEGKIVIKEFDPDMATLFIDFIYRDEVAEDAVSWELFEMAKMYAVSRLEGLCLCGIRKNLAVDNVCVVLEASAKHDLDEMFDEAVWFIRRNKAEVTKTDGWKAVTANSALLEKLALHSS